MNHKLITIIKKDQKKKLKRNIILKSEFLIRGLIKGNMKRINIDKTIDITPNNLLSIERNIA